MIREIVQNLLVYVVMITILKGLVSEKGFLEIFRFVSGMILILLFVSPVLSVLSLDAGWYEKLEKNIFQIDQSQMEQEMRVADGSFEKILQKECESQLEQQIQDLAKEEGQKVRQVEVSMNKEEGNWEIDGVCMELTAEENSQKTAESEKQISPVDKIVVDSNYEKQKKTEGQEDEDTLRLKKKICKKYQLSGKKVNVWKTK